MLSVLRWILCALSLATAPATLVHGQTELEAQELARLLRLGAIAHALQDEQNNAVELATEAVRLCGFVLWNEDRELLAEPTGAPRLQLAITDAEIRSYALMFREGQTVAREDLVAALDVLYRGLGTEKSVKPFMDEWIRDGERSSHASVRALTTFLHELGAHRGAPLDAIEDGELDPLQALLIVRVLTEDLATPLRRAIARGEVGAGEPEPPGGFVPREKKDDEGDAPSPSAAPRGPRVAEAGLAPGAAQDPPPAPGWAEDAYVGGVSGLFGEVADHLGRLGRSVSSATNRANAISSIAKFIATYTFLRGEMSVDAPGQPLVRTKNQQAGEERTLIARFFIDGTRVTDWLKANRRLAAVAGLDLDMPQTGALKGIETAWDIEQDRRYATRQIVQTAGDEGDLSRKKTDQNGEARVRVEGKPQPRDLDPHSVLPLLKTVRVTVTPQVKATEIQQDLVDAVTGAIGISGGPSGLLTPIIECLYRLKWKGGRWMTLEVRDWQPAETIGQLEVSISASGSTFERGSSRRMTLNRRLVLSDVHLQTIGVDPPPPIDPKVLQRASPQVRAQIEAGMRAMTEAAKYRQFQGRGIGTVELHIHDVSSGNWIEADCGSSDQVSAATTSDADLVKEVADEDAPWSVPFRADVDLEKRIVVLNFGQVDAEARVVSTKRRRSGTERNESTERLSIFSNLRLDPPFASKIELPLQETEIPGMRVSNYHGAVPVPFTFGSDYRGTAIVSYSVTRKLPPEQQGR